MEWKELVISVLGAEEGRQDLLSEVAGLEKRKRTLEDTLEGLESSRPWEDKGKNILSRAWSYTAYPGHRRAEEKTVASLTEVREQFKSVESELKSLEAKLAQEARDYLMRNPGIDQGYDAARQQLSHLSDLTYRLNDLHKHAGEALKGVTLAKQDYEYSQTVGWGSDGWWLSVGMGWLRGAREEVGSLAHYEGLLRDISAYLPKEAQELENGIKLARMLELEHIERLSKPLAHLTEFKQSVTDTKRAFQRTNAMYQRMMDRQVQQFLTRIRNGAF